MLTLRHNADAMKVISKKNVSSPNALAQILAERQVLARTLDCPFLVGLKFRCVFLVNRLSSLLADHAVRDR